MLEQLKNSGNSVKEYWSKQPQKRKMYFGAAALGVVLIAAIITAVLNFYNSGYMVLYPGIEQKESAELYSTLQGMSVPAQVNSKGEVMVEKERADELLIELSGMGYPKTAPTYNVFSDNSGFTTTEFEKKQYLLFQLQDRIQTTLKQITGVKNAVVTLDVPEESNYVWDNTDQKSRASVLLTMVPGYKLSPQKVSAIKNLVASSVPKMASESVTVVDAATSLELKSQNDGSLLEGFDIQRLGFETEMEKKIEDKVTNILSLGYDPSRIRVSAAVVIDYDKMITEEMNYVAGDNGNGVKSHTDESYSADGTILAQGTVGASGNTGVPQYANGSSGGNSNYSNYQSSTDYLVSYIKKQIEKNNAILKETSVAVALNDPKLNDQKKGYLVETISKAVNIKPESISVISLDLREENAIEAGGAPYDKTDDWMIPAVIGAMALVIIALLMIVIFRLKKKKQTVAEEPEKTIVEVFEEIEDEKKRLKEIAQASVEKGSAIADEIKKFSNSNPEITASLIRTWLKEDE